MLSFLKRKHSGADIAAGLLHSIGESYSAGFPQDRDRLPQNAQIDLNAVRQEWLYFRIFLIDFAAYNALGQTPEKGYVLTPFWRAVESWLGAAPVAALPERLAVAGGGPRTIPAEPSEPAFTRLSRRMQQYASAVTAPHPQGESYSVAAVFAASCGDMDALSILGVAAYFSSVVSQTTEALSKARIVV
jgi:hypothetical protein